MEDLDGVVLWIGFLRSMLLIRGVSFWDLQLLSAVGAADARVHALILHFTLMV